MGAAAAGGDAAAAGAFFASAAPSGLDTWEGVDVVAAGFIWPPCPPSAPASSFARSQEMRSSSSYAR